MNTPVRRFGQTSVSSSVFQYCPNSGDSLVAVGHRRGGLRDVDCDDQRLLCRWPDDGDDRSRAVPAGAGFVGDFPVNGQGGAQQGAGHLIVEHPLLECGLG